MKATTSQDRKHQNGVKDLDMIMMPPPILMPLKHTVRKTSSFSKLLTQAWLQKAIQDNEKWLKQKLVAAKRKALQSSMAKLKLKRKQHSSASVATKPMFKFCHTKRQLNFDKN